MTLTQQLIKLIEEYAELRGLSTFRVSNVVLNGGLVYRKLTEGKDIYVRRLEHAFQWFSDHWPDETPWPEGIARPPKSETTS